MADEANCPQMEAMQANGNPDARVVQKLWVPFALLQLLTAMISHGTGWPPWLRDAHGPAHAWLFTLKPEIRKRLTRNTFSIIVLNA